MRHREHEPTQPGNPQKLTTRQHVFPAASIARFGGADGCVTVFDVQRKKTWRAKPEDQAFCARRVWDQRAESGYMRQIEDEFQELACRVIANPTNAMNASEMSTARYFFALWRARAEFRNTPDEDIQLNGVTGHDWGKETEEHLERNRVGFLRPGGRMPARQLHGMQIQRDVDHWGEVLKSDGWGVVTLAEGEYIIPDAPAAGVFIPLTPMLALFWGHKSGTFTGAQGRDLNEQMIAKCQNYLICRSAATIPKVR